MALDLNFMKRLLPIALKYSLTTVSLAFCVSITGLLLAFVITIIRDKNVPFLSRFFKIYVSFFRGTPLIAQLFCFYFGIIPVVGLVGVLNSYKAAYIVMSLNSSAYMSESLRAALSSVPEGQMQAAKAVGMTYFQAMRRIIFPQAIRIAIPTLSSSFINIIKDTSLVFSIGVKEIMAVAQLEAASSYKYVEAFVCVLLVYWVITSIVGKLQIITEKYTSRKVGLYN